MFSNNLANNPVAMASYLAQQRNQSITNQSQAQQQVYSNLQNAGRQNMNSINSINILQNQQHIYRLNQGILAPALHSSQTPLMNTSPSLQTNGTLGHSNQQQVSQRQQSTINTQEAKKVLDKYTLELKRLDETILATLDAQEKSRITAIRLVLFNEFTNWKQNMQTLLLQHRNTQNVTHISTLTGQVSNINSQNNNMNLGSNGMMNNIGMMNNNGMINNNGMMNNNGMINNNGMMNTNGMMNNNSMMNSNGIPGSSGLINQRQNVTRNQLQTNLPLLAMNADIIRQHAVHIQQHQKDGKLQGSDNVMITRPIQNVNSISNSSMGYTPLPQYNHRFGITQHHTLSKCSRKYPLIYIDSEVKSDSKFDHLMKEVGVDVSSDMRKVIFENTDAFLENLISFSCSLARHRNASNSIGVKDVQCALSVQCEQVQVQGYNSTNKIRKIHPTSAHISRVAFIKKTISDNNTLERSDKVKEKNALMTDGLN